MITITNEEYRALIKAQGQIESIKWVLNNDEFTYDGKKVEIIEAVIGMVPDYIPFNEKEELF